jgi:hypothetical protein
MITGTFRQYCRKVPVIMEKELLGGQFASFG